MTTPLFELENTDGRLTIRGDCDMANADQIDAWLGGFDGAPIQLDLSGVTFLDSAILHVLIRAKQRNIAMNLVNPSAIVLRLLDLTGTRDYLMNHI